MAAEKKIELEAGIPGLAKAKVSRSASLTETRFAYSCEVQFDSFEAAKEFRAVVEKAVAEMKGSLAQSHVDTIEISEG